MSLEENKKRRLPDWLAKPKQVNTAESRDEDDSSLPKKSRVLPSSFYDGFSDEKLPLLQYKGRMIYCYHKDECNFMCEELMSTLSDKTEIVMGFDMEWKVSYIKGSGSRKTALIQLCPSEDTCYLFQLSRMLGFPVGLKMLLENEKMVKTGVAIQGDIDKLSREFDVYARNIVDLSVLANEKLKSNENWRLTGLIMNLFNHQLDKNNNIRCSDWEVMPLSYDQKLYAATDAYAGFIVYHKLMTMK